jgi:hypothetical protein
MSGKSDEEVFRTKDDLEMMRRPHLWPASAVLCLKNPRLISINGWPRFAVLFLRKGEYYFLPRCEAGFEEEKIRRGGEEILPGLIGEGWIVD